MNIVNSIAESLAGAVLITGSTFASADEGSGATSPTVAADQAYQAEIEGVEENEQSADESLTGDDIASLAAQGEVVEFAVMGKELGGVGSEVPVSLESSVAALDSASEVDANDLTQGARELESLALPAPDGRYNTVSHWKDGEGRGVHLRKGYYEPATAFTKERGFGHIKMYRKHNVTKTAAYASTRMYASTIKKDEKREYLAPVNYVTCSGRWIFRTCKVTARTILVTIHDGRTLRDGKSFGIVTSYCTGYIRCPDWVKRAANI
ncbi:hypothetical protein [Kytococcus sp. HMSC28H12]|uniref:hypothetical protein n=2 Tax=Kytococcus TaxID=57499 RepID=UPI00114CDD8B|nr:hypothetical protein [Kytococcus sp. HMSC28H12]